MYELYFYTIVNYIRCSSQLLRKKCPYSELFWSAFSPHFAAFGLNTERYGVCLRIQSKCGKMRIRISQSARVWENANHNNSEYRYFLRSDNYIIYIEIRRNKSWFTIESSIVPQYTSKRYKNVSVPASL